MSNDIEIEDMDLSLKVIVVGDGQVGKTTLATRFVEDVFTSEYKKTLGVDFLSKKKYVKRLDREVEFIVWDTAGQEMYNAITKRYYRGSNACLIVFAIDNRKSFEDAEGWFQKVKAECQDIVIYLIMAKVDLCDSAVVSDDEGKILAEKLGVKFVKVSSKKGSMVNEVFDGIAYDHFKKGLSGCIKDNVDDIANNISNRNEDIPEIKEEVKNINKSNNKFQLKVKDNNTENKYDKQNKKKKECC